MCLCAILLQWLSATKCPVAFIWLFIFTEPSNPCNLANPKSEALVSKTKILLPSFYKTTLPLTSRFLHFFCFCFDPSAGKPRCWRSGHSGRLRDCPITSHKHLPNLRRLRPSPTIGVLEQKITFTEFLLANVARFFQKRCS